MSAYRAGLVKRMIYIYGSEENGLVIKFVEYCEKWQSNPQNDKALAFMVRVHESEH